MCIPEAWQAWDQHCEQEECKLQRYPRCDICNEYILDDQLIDIDGDLFHEECFMEQHRKVTENYIE